MNRGRLRVVPTKLSPVEELHKELLALAQMFEVFARSAMPLQEAASVMLYSRPEERPREAPEVKRQEVAQLAMSTGILRIALEEFEHKLGAYARTMKR